MKKLTLIILSIFAFGNIFASGSEEENIVKELESIEGLQNPEDLLKLDDASLNKMKPAIKYLFKINMNSLLDTLEKLDKKAVKPTTISEGENMWKPILNDLNSFQVKLLENLPDRIKSLEFATSQKNLQESGQRMGGFFQVKQGHVDRAAFNVFNVFVKTLSSSTITDKIDNLNPNDLRKILKITIDAFELNDKIDDFVS